MTRDIGDRLYMFDSEAMVDRKIIDSQLDVLRKLAEQTGPDGKRMLNFLATFLYYNSDRLTIPEALKRLDKEREDIFYNNATKLFDLHDKE